MEPKSPAKTGLQESSTKVSNDLDKALDALEGPGVIEVQEVGGKTRVEVVESDRLGVRVRGVHVGHNARDMRRVAEVLPDRIHALPGKLMPVEVAPILGGATLRTRPEDMRRERFFEVKVREDGTDIRRYQISAGERKSKEWTLTREQLHDLVDEVRRPIDDE